MLFNLRNSEGGDVINDILDNEPIFNDDLLTNPGDYEALSKRFESIMHVLYDENLQTYFLHYDIAANIAKRSSRKSGAWAIGLGTIAILLAGVEIITDYYITFFVTAVGHHVTNVLLFLIAGIAAACGIASVIVGRMRVLIGKRKRQWLHNRFMSETIRQFHFQSLIVHLPEILDSLKGADECAKQSAREIYKAKRAEWWSEFQNEFRGRIGPMFDNVIDFSDRDGWRHRRRKLHDIEGDRLELEPLFEAYRLLRLQHQYKYARYKLQDDHKIFLSSFPRQQAAVLRAVGTWGIGALFTIHILVIGFMIIFATLVGGVDVFAEIFSLWSGLLNSAIILIPIVILATHAFENGLLPEWEVDRYEKYQAATAAALEQYDVSNTQAEKIIAMLRMEQLAFEEMRDFLRANNRAIFMM